MTAQSASRLEEKFLARVADGQPLLSTKYSLHDVNDVETFCARAAHRYCDKTRTRLQPTDFESLVSFLVVSVWRFSERYDPAKHPSFRAACSANIANRCTDWMRQHRGRARWQWKSHSYERERPQPLSLDTPTADDGYPLVETLGAVDSDLEASGDPGEFGGLLVGRDSEAAWDTAVVRALARRLLRERDQQTRAA